MLRRGRIDENDSLGARDHVEEFNEVLDGVLVERENERLWEVAECSDMVGDLVLLFSLASLLREGGTASRRGVELDGEVERLVVRCLDAYVDPLSELLRGPETDRFVETLDKRLVERLGVSLEFDAARLLEGCGGASILPRVLGLEVEETERLEYDPTFLARECPATGC